MTERSKDMTERVIERAEVEYTKLMAVASLLEMMSPNGAAYYVQDVYLDYGQDWMWTTIVRRGYRECQVLNPREWKEIMAAQTPMEIARIVDSIRSDEYFGDK